MQSTSCIKFLQNQDQKVTREAVKLNCKQNQAIEIVSVNAFPGKRRYLKSQ